MIALSQTKTKRLLAVHGWSGVVLGLFLYIVVLTGALAVFAGEIGEWSVGGKRWSHPFDKWVGVALNSTAKTVPSEFHDEISIFSRGQGRLIFFYHTHATNQHGDIEDKGVVLEIDPETHKVLSRREGFRSDLFGHDSAGALRDFLVDLHVKLHVPNPWGLYLTGLLGFAMLAGAVSGVLLHRHVLTDLFLSPRLSSRLLNARDRHNLIGSWTLPFAIILAFTGAFLSFALSIGVPLLSTVGFGGDNQAMFEVLVGESATTKPPRPAIFVQLDGVLNQSRERAGARVESVSIRHYGRSDAEIAVTHPPAPGDYRFLTYIYDGTTGIFKKIKPTLGTRPSVGDSVFGVTLALHFGIFAGILSRVIWLGLGLAMAYVTLTGMRLWLERRADDPLWRTFARALPTVGYGLPVALAVSGLFFLVALPSETARFWTPVGFLVGSAAAIAAGVLIADARRLTLCLKAALGVALILLVPLRLIVTGLGWDAPGGGEIVLLLDAALLAAGVHVCRGTWPKRWREQPEGAPAQIPSAPAE